MEVDFGSRWRLASGVQGTEDVCRIGTDAVVSICFGEGNDACSFVVRSDNKGRGERKTPGGIVLIAVDEGDIDEDGAVVRAEGFGDGVADAERLGDAAARVREDGKGK